MKEIHAHFKMVDPAIAMLMENFPPKKLSANLKHSQYFSKLCHDIIGQQLSNKVADVLVTRFNDLFEHDHPTADHILELPEQKLRDVGMAWSKVRAIRDLANRQNAGDLHFDRYTQMTNDEVIQDLIQIKGIGPWTAETFLIFTLGREDIFSIKDLGLKKAAMKLYKLKPTKTLDARILKITSKWAPYRSYASLALWGSLDGDSLTDVRDGETFPANGERWLSYNSTMQPKRSNPNNSTGVCGQRE